jgi:hypothetical protein
MQFQRVQGAKDSRVQVKNSLLSPLLPKNFINPNHVEDPANQTNCVKIEQLADVSAQYCVAPEVVAFGSGHVSGRNLYGKNRRLERFVTGVPIKSRRPRLKDAILS